MFAINVILTARDAGDVEKLGELLREAGRLSRAEPGCRQFEVCHSESDPRVFLLIERWDSKQAWEVHKTAPAFTGIYQPQVLPLVERVPHFCEILD